MSNLPEIRWDTILDNRQYDSSTVDYLIFEKVSPLKKWCKYIPQYVLHSDFGFLMKPSHWYLNHNKLLSVYKYLTSKWIYLAPWNWLDWLTDWLTALLGLSLHAKKLKQILKTNNEIFKFFIFHQTGMPEHAWPLQLKICNSYGTLLACKKSKQ